MKIKYFKTREKMEFIDIKLMIFREEIDLLCIIEYQRSENPRNEHLPRNIQIDWSNDIQILKFIYPWKAKNQRILRRPKLLNSNFYSESNWPTKSTSEFWWKINSARSNVKLKGQMSSEFDEFAIHRNMIKRGIRWNQNQVIWKCNQRYILFSKSEKFQTKIW